MAIQIPYGLRNGSVVHVGDVVSGVSCECVCLNCGGELIARKGAVRQQHFAHRSGQECAGLAEGVLHKAAKELLCGVSQFEVPPYVWERSRRLAGAKSLTHKKQLIPGGKIRVLRADPEFRTPPNFIPDVALLAESARQKAKQLFVEIVVSNRINRLKQRKIRRYGVPTIEIHLTPEDLALSLEQMRRKLEGLSKAKRWIFHPAQIACEKTFIAEYRRRRPEAINAMRAQLAKDVSRDLPSRMCSIKRARPARMADFLECERFVERFYDRHRRLPSLAETKAFLKR